MHSCRSAFVFCTIIKPAPVSLKPARGAGFHLYRAVLWEGAWHWGLLCALFLRNIPRRSNAPRLILTEHSLNSAFLLFDKEKRSAAWTLRRDIAGITAYRSHGLLFRIHRALQQHRKDPLLCCQLRPEHSCIRCNCQRLRRRLLSRTHLPSRLLQCL